MQAGLVADPLFWLLAVPAVLLLGISKGGFGGGVGLVAVPMLALSVPLPQAAGILLPILCAMDLFALAAYRRHWSRSNVRTLLPPALLGIAAGVWAFGALDERWIRGLVGAVAVAFALQYWAGLARRGGVELAPARAPVWSGWLWGAASGFTSTIAHAGGPPMSIYLLPQRLDRTVYVGTTVVLFTVFNYAKLAPYAWLGALDGQNLLTSLSLMPLAPLGIQLGRWLQLRVSEILFYRIAYALLLAVGAQLLVDAFA